MSRLAQSVSDRTGAATRGTRKARVRSALAFTRAVLAIVLWMVLLLKAHEVSHAYDWEASGFLGSELARLLVVAVALTALTELALLSLPTRFRLGRRGLIILCAWFAVLVLGHSLSDEEVNSARALIATVRDAAGPSGLAALALVHALALAIPFVPSVEVGLTIMALFGRSGAVAVYLATITGLLAAFAVGRWLPPSALRGLLGALTRTKPAAARAAGPQLARTRAAHIDGDPPDTGDVLERSGQQALRRMPPWLQANARRYRFVLLAVLLNLPGNSAIGGGGGIALVSGMSRAFTPRSFALTVAAATSPLPLLVFVGVLDVDRMLQQRRVICDMLTLLQDLIPGL